MIETSASGDARARTTPSRVLPEGVERAGPKERENRAFLEILNREFFFMPKPPRRSPATPARSEEAQERLGPVHASNWPATRTVMRPRSELRAYDRNARQHDPDQIAQIARSMEEFGFTVPILIDEEGQILAGHGRWEAAALAGIDIVPTIEARGWSAEQKRAYVIADNQLALTATWNTDLLHAELRDLSGSNFDLGLIGFDAGALSVMLNPEAEGTVDPEEVPETPPVPTSALGDVWILGNHRLTCGDSTDPAAVARALDGAQPHLMVTDPQYGVEYDPAWRGKAKRTGGNRLSLGVHAKGQVLNDDRVDWSKAWKLFPGDVAYVWCAPGPLHCDVKISLDKCSIICRTMIVWSKSNFAIGRGHYHPQFEVCWYSWREGKTSHWVGDRKQSTVWDIPKPAKSETGHGTQKPIECMKRPIENNSAPGDHVYEPFSGSGTTIIAGEMTGRWVHAIELSPAYVDVAVLRWQAFTGREAILEGSGETFERIAAARSAAREVNHG